MDITILADYLASILPDWLQTRIDGQWVYIEDEGAPITDNATQCSIRIYWAATRTYNGVTALELADPQVFKKLEQIINKSIADRGIS